MLVLSSNIIQLAPRYQLVKKKWPYLIGGSNSQSYCEYITAWLSISDGDGPASVYKSDARLYWVSQLAVDLAVVVQKWGSCRPQNKEKGDSNYNSKKKIY